VGRAAGLAIALLIVLPAAANARLSSGCASARPPAIGVSIGRSSPYFEPAGVVANESLGSLHLAARADVPVAGPWRVRVEGASTGWRLERTTYSADLRDVVARDIVGRVDVKHVAAVIGRQAGRAPACAYVLAGAGLYALDYQNAGWFAPGGILVAGIEFPGGPRGAVQVDVQLHLVKTGVDGQPPIGSSVVVDGRLSVGWVFYLRR
jgi:hypothetical protein